MKFKEKILIIIIFKIKDDTRVKEYESRLCIYTQEFERLNSLIMEKNSEIDLLKRQLLKSSVRVERESIAFMRKSMTNFKSAIKDSPGIYKQIDDYSQKIISNEPSPIKINSLFKNDEVQRKLDYSSAIKSERGSQYNQSYSQKKDSIFETDKIYSVNTKKEDFSPNKHTLNGKFFPNIIV